MKSLATTVLIGFAALNAAAENKCPTSNGYITTKVEAKAKTSFLHTVQHHWKFEFWKGAVCWGSPDDQYQASQEAAQASNQCSGSMNMTTSQAGQHNYTPLALSWGANLTDGDTFTINLTDDRVQAAYAESSSKCTTHKYGSKLEYASVVYDTKAVINVPQDVWIVQVRAKSEISAGSNLNELNPRIGRQVLKDENNPAAFLQSLSAREWTYLYVEPGEALELALSYSNQGLQGTKKYNVQYDFKFVGHNRCTEVLGDPSRVNYSQEYLDKVIRADINSEADYHNYALKLGCMRNPVFLKAAMNGSRPESLIPALQTLTDRTEEVLRTEVKKGAGTYTGPFMATILDMTLVDVSRFALSDLMNYCKTYRDFTRETAVNPQVTEVAGVEFMMMTYSHLDKIYSRLSRQSLNVLVNNLQTWSKENVTYAQLFDGNKDTQQALKAYQQAMIQMGLEIYSTMHKEISNRVPSVEIAKKQREELLKDLDSAKTVASYLNVSLRQMLRNFGSRSNDIVESAEIAANVKQLSELDAKIHAQMKDYFKWFISSSNGGDNGDRFVSTLATLQKAFLGPAAENLTAISKIENLKSLEEKFVRRGELNRLNQEINKCVFQPYGAPK